MIGIILIYQLRAYEASNDLTRQSLDLNKKSFTLTAKSLEEAQEGIKAAQRANEIAQKNLLAATTPSMDVRITNIERKGQTIEIKYDITNHSNSPARAVTAFCNLLGIKGYIDGALMNGLVSIIPL